MPRNFLLLIEWRVCNNLSQVCFCFLGLVNFWSNFNPCYCFQLAQKDNNQQMGNSTKETRTSKAENESTSKVHLVKNRLEKNKDELPPFHKRKAFVSQKSKTIQDEGYLESSTTKEPCSNFSKILEPDENDSDLENIPPQNTSMERSENLPEQKKNSSFVKVMENNSNKSGDNIKSNGKEGIINQLLEEEMLKSSTTKMFVNESIVVEEDESSRSETCSETGSESESSAEVKRIEKNLEGRELKQTTESSDNHLLFVETQLAEQSLKR